MSMLGFEISPPNSPKSTPPKTLPPQEDSIKTTDKNTSSSTDQLVNHSGDLGFNISPPNSPQKALSSLPSKQAPLNSKAATSSANRSQTHPPSSASSYLNAADAKRSAGRIKAVCHIKKSDSKNEGTGCLIEGNLLLTNHHVIKSPEEALKSTAIFHQIISQDLNKSDTSYRLVTAEFDPKRYFFTSSNNIGKDEKGNSTPIPAGINLKGEECLDFTLIALKHQPSLKSRQSKAFCLFTKTHPLTIGDTVSILQHPELEPNPTSIGLQEKDIKIASGRVKKIENYSLQYGVTAKTGSSGGAVIDKRGTLVALHYQKSLLSDNWVAGVRISKIAEMLSRSSKNQQKTQQEKIEEQIKLSRAFYKDKNRAIIERPLIPRGVIDLPLPPDNFTGRKEILKTLHQSWQESNRVVLSGLGGVGKTATVLQYAREHKGEYAFVHFIRGMSLDLITQGLLHLANELKIPGRKPHERLAMLKTRLNKLKNPFLLIFDGVDDPSCFKKLEELLPSEGRCLLVTSRLSNYEGRGFVRLGLIPFNEEEAIEFLMKTVNDTDKEGAKALAKELGYLPLALTHAAAYIRKTQGKGTFAGYLRLFEKHGINLHQQKHLRLTKEEETILTTWNISLNAIHKESKEAVKVACFLSSLAHAPIPKVIVGQWFKGFINHSDLDLRTALGLLDDYSFIETKDTLCHIHMLVQRVIRYGLLKRKPADYKKYQEGALETLAKVSIGLNGEDPKQSRRLGSLIPHIISVLDSNFTISKENSFFLLDLLKTAWSYYYYIGCYKESKEMANKRLNIENASDDLIKANSLFMLGKSFWALSKYKDALSVFLDSLNIKLKSSKERSVSDLARNYKEIAATYHGLGKYEEALCNSQKALEESKKGIEKDLIYLCENDVGSCYLFLGEFKKALSCYQRALQTLNNKYSKRKDHIAMSHYCIGMVFARIQSWAKALDFGLKAIEIFKEASLEALPDLAIFKNMVGYCLVSMNKPGESEKYLKDALDIRLKFLGENHLYTSLTYKNFGLKFQKEQNYLKALQCYLRSLEIQINVKDINHPYSVESCGYIGVCLYELKDFKTSLFFLNQFEKGFNPSQKHPDLIELASKSRKILISYEEGNRSMDSRKPIKDFFNEPSHVVVKALTSLGQILKKLGQDELASNYLCGDLKVRAKAPSFEETIKYFNLKRFYESMAFDIKAVNTVSSSRIEKLNGPIKNVATQVFSELETDIIIRTLRQSPVLSTMEHHSSLTQHFQINGAFSHAILRKFLNDQAMIVFACSTIKMDNSFFPGKLFMEGKKLPLLTRKFDKILVAQAPASKLDGIWRQIRTLYPDRKKSEMVKKVVSWLSKQSASILELPKLWAQISKFNSLFWKSILDSDLKKILPTLYFSLPMEKIVGEALIRDMTSESKPSWLISCILNPDLRSQLFKSLDSCRICWNSKNKTGTFLFWGLSKGKPVSLFPSSGKLISKDQSISIPIEKTSLIASLRDGQIIPSAGLSIMYLSLYCGLFLLGGPFQVNYLEDMRLRIYKKFKKNLDLNDLIILNKTKTNCYLHLVHNIDLNLGGLERIYKKISLDKLWTILSLNHKDCVIRASDSFNLNQAELIETVGYLHPRLTFEGFVSNTQDNETDIFKLAPSNSSVSNSSSILNNTFPINTHSNLSSVHDFTAELTAIENKQKPTSVYELQKLENAIKAANLPNSQKQSLLARVEKIFSEMSGSSNSK